MKFCRNPNEIHLITLTYMVEIEHVCLKHGSINHVHELVITSWRAWKDLEQGRVPSAWLAMAYNNGFVHPTLCIVKLNS